MDVQTITPKELEELRRQGRTVELIDVRTPVEYREVHAEPARLGAPRCGSIREPSWKPATARRTSHST